MKRITAERMRRQWSKTKLAQQAKLHPSQMSLIESGRMVPYEGQLERLAEALDIAKSDASSLMDEVDLVLSAAPQSATD